MTGQAISAPAPATWFQSEHTARPAWRQCPSRCRQSWAARSGCASFVDIDNIRVELVQLRRAEHGILPVLGVFTLVKFRLDAVLQQKQPQLVGHLIGGRAAEDGDFLCSGCGFWASSSRRSLRFCAAGSRYQADTGSSPWEAPL